MHPRNRTKYKTLDKVAKDPRVKEVWSEEFSGDGLWANLEPGYNAEGCSGLHEYSCKGLIQALARIETGEPY